jgi:hypothetical protein
MPQTAALRTSNVEAYSEYLRGLQFSNLGKLCTGVIK